MSEEILVNVTPRETRVAVVENGVLQEVQIERVARRGLVGGIFKGCVSRVMPGMDAAFVDIGLEKAAFIHASDVNTLPRSSREPAPSDDGAEHEAISNLLHDGQQVLQGPAQTVVFRHCHNVAVAELVQHGGELFSLCLRPGNLL